MTAEQLIKILQAVDPKGEVAFSVGQNDSIALNYAKVELMTNGCLGYLRASDVEIHTESAFKQGGIEYPESSTCNIILDQDNLTCDDFEKELEAFNKKYQEIKY